MKSWQNSTLHSILPNKYGNGATLVVSLLMLLVILLLSMSMANMALTDEKVARNERERQIALNAAESALLDAEMDIDNPTSTRSTVFSSQSAIGFTEDCGIGATPIHQGLCLYRGNEQAAAWRSVDLADTSSNSASVSFGRFTGRNMPDGGPTLSIHKPRYIIELMPDNEAGQSESPSFIYRITAIGFGTTTKTQAVVQSVYRKARSDRLP